MSYLKNIAPVIALAALTAGLHSAEPPEPNKGGPAEMKFIKYRLIGPAAGGRVARATGVPGDPVTYYAATAAGGVWKSVDGGIHWKSIFDDQPVSSIGSIAVAPSDPNVIYVGSGETNIRGNVAAGNGIYKSTDAGKNWTHVWKQEGQIGTMVVHPKNPDIAHAAVLGHAFGPNPERGVYRTTDGGKTWQKVLFQDAETGASDICLDPSNPRILFAGFWQTRRRPWEMTSGGPGSALYTSRDGGDSWKKLTGKGLPEGIWGKIGVAVSPSDGRHVYALIEAEKGGLFRSDNGGEKWELVNAGRFLRQRAWYYTTLTIDPTNPDVIWCPSVRMLKSIDGGKTFHSVKGFHHGDHHDLWIDPQNPRRMINSNDGGVEVTANGGETWYAAPLPISQFYHIAVDNRQPYHVSGTMQDLGTASGPSNSLAAPGIGLGDWYGVGGGETGFTVPDPSDPNIVYAGEYGGYISRYDHRTRQARNVTIYPENPSGHGAADLRYRFQWTAPIAVSPHDPRVIYHAGNVLFRTSDGGLHWSAISPDLTRNDKSKQQWSGGPITGDNTGVEVYGTIFAVTESPKEKGVLWTGSDDGYVQVSRDGGQHWINVTKNISGMPECGTVRCIEASRFDGGTAYLVVDNHRMDDMRPYLFRTKDYGQTWDRLDGPLPQDVYLHVVREDPAQQGLLFAGTERGIMFSTDDGATWEALKLNLPTVAVHDLAVKNNDLVVGTMGRSIWILDDLTPIRQWKKAFRMEAVHLFAAPSATRWRYDGGAPHGDRYAGANPPKGAIIHYFLREKAKGPITIEIRDSKGGLVRKLSSKPEPDDLPPGDPDGPEEEPKKEVLLLEPGIQRAVWDLCYTGATTIQGAKIDAGNPKVGPLAAPGIYTVKLLADGQSQTTQVQVQADPRLAPSLREDKAFHQIKVALQGENGQGTRVDANGQAELAFLDEQVQLALHVRDDISRIARLVHGIRLVKKQLAARAALLKDDKKAEALLKQSKELTEKLDAVEAKLHNPKAEVTYDILAQKGGAQLYSRLGTLYEAVQDSDGPITQGVREIFTEQKRELNELEGKVKKLLAEDLIKLNEMAKNSGAPVIVVPSLAAKEDK
jgi:photosystem II stability/assembly factor-like uncharacterized protein